MIINIKINVAKENGKWIGHWQEMESSNFDDNIIQANRREELERKLDKTLRLTFPDANYIIQHKEVVE